mmetsp:Transcript_12687/g.21168  ORF Transcript_12687/g.21168 Transcript_12687/m.21168 type:complete len:86 (+) Transcript_12687:210-467(+)|eukprot:CAMPEP_0197716050 /NCGR_PEP_ID=MMETSP1434-20131217/1087_1 /TAXON_ID=265543 /ORGANISM="Minutocellus polymorphus, Strain CCMP3303" /LENGTH=85 /DNA_ID=CAMNT_0043300355 /DNA_START=197 /DNA_END=454 /DNA_ORIENTATION=-
MMSSMGKTDAKYQSMFKKFDKDGSGFIDNADVKKLVHGAISDDKIEKIMGYADKSKDGKLDYNEFKSIMKKIEMAQKFLGSKGKK